MHPAGAAGGRRAGPDQHRPGAIAQCGARHDVLSVRAGRGRCGVFQFAAFRGRDSRVVPLTRYRPAEKSGTGSERILFSCAASILAAPSAALAAFLGMFSAGLAALIPTRIGSRALAAGRRVRLDRDPGRLDLSVVRALGVGRRMAGPAWREFRTRPRFCRCGRRRLDPRGRRI